MITIANCDGDDRDLIAFGRLLRELNHYAVTPARLDKPLLSTEFDVYIWRAGIKKFKRIGVRSSYYAADGLIRQHIRRRYRRRVRRRQPPLVGRCDECQRLTRVGWFSAMCFDCCDQLRRDDQSPDDYPAFDANQLFH